MLVPTLFHNYFHTIEGTKAPTTITLEKIYTNTFQNTVGDMPLDEVTVTTVERCPAEV